jgi:prevent-host-death family protein
MSDRDPAQTASPHDLSPRYRSPRVADDALVFTMRDLNQQTARIMNEIEKTGRPAFITKHGRFVAIITPLAPGQVESRVLAEMAREIAAQRRPDGR